MNYQPTDLPPGTLEKIELMRSRAEKGLPVFHPCDRSDYRGLTGVALPLRNQGRKGGYRFKDRVGKSADSVKVATRGKMLAE